MRKNLSLIVWTISIISLILACASIWIISVINITRSMN